MLNKKGFTLVEVLAVVAILGTLISFSVIAIFKFINTSNKQRIAENIKAIKESALNYALAEDLYFKPCNLPNKLECDNFKKIDVQFLIDNNYYKDPAKSCDKEAVLIIYMDDDYNYQVEIYSENICK